MGSPVLYRQVRIGRDGRRFEMLKFRTMKGDPASEGEADADWAREQIGADPTERWPTARRRADAGAGTRRAKAAPTTGAPASAACCATSRSTSCPS